MACAFHQMFYILLFFVCNRLIYSQCRLVLIRWRDIRSNLLKSFWSKIYLPDEEHIKRYRWKIFFLIRKVKGWISWWISKLVLKKQRNQKSKTQMKQISIESLYVDHVDYWFTIFKLSFILASKFDIFFLFKNIFISFCNFKRHIVLRGYSTLTFFFFALYPFSKINPLTSL